VLAVGDGGQQNVPMLHGGRVHHDGVHILPAENRLQVAKVRDAILFGGRAAASLIVIPDAGDLSLRVARNLASVSV
jgi:hypothetical protein